MPVIKSAIKKLRQDRKHEAQNDILRASLKMSVRAAKKSKSGKSVSKAMSIVDKAAKNNLIHKNKASRMKVTLSKLAKPSSLKSAVKPSPKTKKTTAKRTAKKTSKKAK